MLLGYVRVSKSDGSQNLDLQKDALEAYGVEKENIYSDYMQVENWMIDQTYKLALKLFVRVTR